MTANSMSRLVHQAFPYRNELATAGDRIESTVLVLGIAVALLAVPVAGAIGSEIYSSQSARAAVEQATKSRAEAILIEDAPPAISMSERGGAVEAASVLATWRPRDGSTRHGAVQAPYDAKAGAAVPIWIGENGEVSEPPLTAEDAALDAIFLALLLWSAAAGSMALFFLATRFAHKQIRMRGWAHDWERIAPAWTGR
ncbi:hypothetical protein SK571_22645 [Lentzea sp. BCCO 10_0798]|jgi:hypothetical protein|uniref:Transmembrane protein n=1 Tax=Lentzea kristufekii TaxID=3095430 RepID=A0ABU4TV47_9PSEU|nr:hypothetical protein [Lentzea sp. BCCO 10_0798]MDX8052193.1 hypothetical protein [Lentzea sp. BCCO 10_0798]